MRHAARHHPGNRRGAASLGLASLALLLVLLSLAPPVVAQAPEEARAVYNPIEPSTQRLSLGQTALFKWDLYNDNASATYTFTIDVDLANSRPWEVVISVGSRESAEGLLRPGQHLTATVELIPRKQIDGLHTEAMVRFTFLNIRDDAQVFIEESGVSAKLSKHGFLPLGIQRHTEFPPELSFLDNNLGRFATQVFLWFVVGLVALGFLWVFGLVASFTQSDLDDILLGIIRMPLLAAILIYGVTKSFEELDFPLEAQESVDTIVGVVLIVLFIWVGYKIFKGIIITYGKELAKKTESEIDDILFPVLEKIGTVVIAIVGAMAIMGYFGVDLTVAAASFGIFGLVIAFAAQSSVANFFGGIFILLDQPFKVGDLILYDGKYCQVRHIGLRSTRLYVLPDHVEIITPNDRLANSPVTNLTAPDRRIKTSVTMGIAYGVDPDAMEELMLQIIVAHPHVLSGEGVDPYAKLDGFGDSAINFKITFWVNEILDHFKVEQYFRKELYRRLLEMGVEIPYPTRTMIARTDTSAGVPSWVTRGPPDLSALAVKVEEERRGVLDDAFAQAVSAAMSEADRSAATMVKGPSKGRSRSTPAREGGGTGSGADGSDRLRKQMKEDRNRPDVDD